MRRSRFWVFTAPMTDGQIQSGFLNDSLFPPMFDGLPHDNCTFLLHQAELGTNSNADRGAYYHYQGYIEFNNAKRLSWLKNHIHPTAHFENRRGTQAQAIAYNSKDDTRISGPWRYGEPCSAGTSLSDQIRSYVALARSGTSFNDAIDAHPTVAIRYPTIYNTLSLTSTSSPRLVQRNVTLLCGPPGSGKTRYVYNYAQTSGDSLFVLPACTQRAWFDGYDRHKLSLFDDFGADDSRIPFTVLLRVLDPWYNPNVEVKHSCVNFSSDVVFITSNLHPFEWYKEISPEHWRALKRRISCVVSYYEDPSSDSGFSFHRFQSQSEEFDAWFGRQFL